MPPCSEGRRPGRALLAGKLLPLHQVEQRHQDARDRGVGGDVGGLEHQLQQRGDHLREALGGLARARSGRQRSSRAARAGRRGHAARARSGEQPGASRGRPLAGGIEDVGLVQPGPHGRLGLDAGRRARRTFGLEARTARGQVKIRAPTLGLHAMHQLAHRLHQRAAARQLLELAHLATACGDEKGQDRFHTGLRE
nr:hypothetical protein [Thauera sp.]